MASLIFATPNEPSLFWGFSLILSGMALRVAGNLGKNQGFNLYQFLPKPEILAHLLAWVGFGLFTRQVWLLIPLFFLAALGGRVAELTQTSEKDPLLAESSLFPQLYPLPYRHEVKPYNTSVPFLLLWGSILGVSYLSSWHPPFGIEGIYLQIPLLVIASISFLLSLYRARIRDMESPF